LTLAAVPEDLKYSRTHEWVRVEGDIVTIGITDHAQAELGDVTYVDLPEPGLQLAHDMQFGEVESVKAVSELFSPVSGEVVATNTDIENKTEALNEDPYGEGWLIKIRLSDPSELAELMDAQDYLKFAEAEGH
jgi:glycine cleavage system H protein